jgi:hypothetical protein
MIDPAESLEEVSRQLRDVVLAQLTDEAARASVAAMDSAAELVAACRSLRDASTVKEWRREIDARLVDVEDCAPAEARDRALAIAEWILLRAHDSDAPSEAALAPLRIALAEDLNRQ